jgi:cytochrome P450
MKNSIINRDGDIWKSRRGLIRPFFVRERLVDFEVLEEFSQKTLDVLSKYPEDMPVDVQDLVARFTMDVGTTFVSDLLFISPIIVEILPSVI